MNTSAETTTERSSG